MNTYPTRMPASRSSSSRERGVVLLFALIALLILMVGAVALVRSFSSSLINTGSIAFKKDLVNRNEAVVAQVLARVRSPIDGLVDEVVAGNHLERLNYSAEMLTNYNAQGIPNLLLVSDTAFDSDPLTRVSNDIVTQDGIRLRYVIDRQCASTGEASLLGAAGCITDPAGASRLLRGSSDMPIRAENTAGGRRGALLIAPVYRLTIRAIGPKGTLAFYQTSFTL